MTRTRQVSQLLRSTQRCAIYYHPVGLKRWWSSASSSLYNSSEPQGVDASNPVTTRYHQLVQQGALKHDPQQLAVVHRLGQLYLDLANYQHHMAQYHHQHHQHQLRKDQRVKELLEQHEQQQRQQQQQQQQQQHKPRQEDLGSSSWWSAGASWLQQLMPSQAAAQQQLRRELTPAQQAKLAVARCEAQAQAELGPGPQPPQAPQGLYIWGSVGSGKSLLMDLFYDAVAEGQLGIRHHRRMHFNAAMLEIHSRLHRLDQQQQQQQQGGVGEAPHEEDEEYEVEDEVEVHHVVSGAASSVAFGQLRGGIFRYWDEGVTRQRQAKRALLAVRRHLRLTRNGRLSPEALAAANSRCLQQVATQFILQATGQVDRQGQGHGLQASSPKHRAAVLCFDEMQVSDVFSAAALKALFERLIGSGCVVLCTSNRPPDELPRHGLHEAMFSHFIDTLHSSCSVLELSSQQDYRRMLMEGLKVAPLAATTPQPAPDSAAAAQQQQQQPAELAHPTYLHPLGPASSAVLEELWMRVAGATGQAPAPSTLQVMFGRTLEVASAGGGAARFTFQELCARPLGAADYIAVASHFHTVFITDIPPMSMQVRDQARRFITLVDELYNARVRLICTAATPPEELFRGAEDEEPILDLEQLQFESAVEGSKLRRDSLRDGSVAPVASSRSSATEARDRLGGMEEKFAFRRAVSRLFEMQSRPYLAATGSRHRPAL